MAESLSLFSLLLLFVHDDGEVAEACGLDLKIYAAGNAGAQPYPAKSFADDSWQPLWRSLIKASRTSANLPANSPLAP